MLQVVQDPTGAQREGPHPEDRGGFSEEMTCRLSMEVCWPRGGCFTMKEPYVNKPGAPEPYLWRAEKWFSMIGNCRK